MHASETFRHRFHIASTEADVDIRRHEKHKRTIKWFSIEFESIPISFGSVERNRLFSEYVFDFMCHFLPLTHSTRLLSIGPLPKVFFFISRRSGCDDVHFDDFPLYLYSIRFPVIYFPCRRKPWKKNMNCSFRRPWLSLRFWQSGSHNNENNVKWAKRTCQIRSIEKKNKIKLWIIIRIRNWRKKYLIS